MNIKNLLLGLLIVAVLAVGILIGYLRPLGNNSTGTKTSSSINSTNSTATETPTTSGTAASMMSNISPDQKKMLGALGIDISKITPAMITCAETSLGATRVEEIKNGASLSLTEKIKLAACYK